MANSNLSKKQFDKASNTEDQQRNRSDRRQFNYADYPFMTGSTIMGSGPATSETEPNETLQQEAAEQAQGDNDSGQTASTDSGMGVGGTTAGMVGTS